MENISFSGSSIDLHDLPNRGGTAEVRRNKRTKKIAMVVGKKKGPADIDLSSGNKCLREMS